MTARVPALRAGELPALRAGELPALRAGEPPSLRDGEPLRTRPPISHIEALVIPSDRSVAFQRTSWPGAVSAVKKPCTVPPSSDPRPMDAKRTSHLRRSATSA